jgi:hypothetical protein
MSELIDEIIEDSDSVLNDEIKLKEVVKDSELVVKLLESKGVSHLDVVVEDVPIALVRSVESYDKEKFQS